MHPTVEFTLTVDLEATISCCMYRFVALLTDGRRIEQSSMSDMAIELHRSGVKASRIQYEWRAGQRMITAGQQVALRAALRDHEYQCSGLAIAA